jgi:hypothetical protein
VRHIFALCIALNCWANAFAQQLKVTSEILAGKQVNELFPDAVRKKLGLNFPIVKVYKYADQTGQFYCILTESRNEVNGDKETLSHTIKAVNAKVENGLFAKVWEINDNVIKNDNDETSVWFWTKYIDFKDYDGDGLADPVIIYGTLASNGYEDGRIKFIIYFKGQKIAIRHQNGVLDSERETQIDSAFYDLPQSLQASIKQIMEVMTKTNQAIFPAGWRKAMKNKKTIFNGRGKRQRT